MVNYIELSGQKHPVRISYYVLKHFKIETGRDLDGFNSVTDIEPVLFYAMQAGYKAINKEMTIKRDDMEFLIDENFDSITKDFPVIMQDLAAANENTEPKKKKLRKKDLT
jgi:hypothetical protein